MFDLGNVDGKEFTAITNGHFDLQLEYLPQILCFDEVHDSTLTTFLYELF